MTDTGYIKTFKRKKMSQCMGKIVKLVPAL